MFTFTYIADLQPETHGQFTVRFRDLPEAITSGVNRDDAVVQAADCLEEAIAGRISDGLEIPKPTPSLRRTSAAITLSGSMAAKTALYLAMRESGVTRSELAKRLKLDEKEIRRMLDPRHPTKLPRIEQALAQLGHRLIVSVSSNAA